MLQRLVLVLLGLCALAAPAVAGDGPDAAALRRARERWERLTPAQQGEARERYERYLSLSEEGQRELRALAERLREAREAHARGLPSDVRRDLAELAPEKRREIVGELFQAEAGERGRDLCGRMPEDLLKRLEDARPEERPELLHRFREQQRGRVARAVIGSLGPRAGLAPEELERLQALPLDERLRAAVELRSEHEARRRRAREAADAAGGDAEEPFGLDAQGWRELAELPPEEFHRRVREHRARRVRELGLDTPTAPGTYTGERPPEPGARPLAAHVARLAQAMRIDPRESLELSELAGPERRAELARRRRERCMEILRAGELLPPERVSELRALEDRAFFDFVRDLIGCGPERTWGEHPGRGPSNGKRPPFGGRERSGPRDGRQDGPRDGSAPRERVD